MDFNPIIVLFLTQTRALGKAYRNFNPIIVLFLTAITFVAFIPV